MDAQSLIRKKHAGGELAPDELSWLVRAGLSGEVPDYQLSALLMAINYEHLSFAETVALTRAFVDSGETIQWSVGQASVPAKKGPQAGTPAPLPVFVDKHSTGGVGDKVSLLLVPWLAAAGFKVAKMSGRGLGFTGGTIDKLESIPGFRTDLSRNEAQRVLDEVGCVILEQGERLVPADKQWYALRDATDTVGELGLIAASVMSKKIACGAPYIVLDVKCGSGAFFKEPHAAREFAQLSRRIGAEFGRKVACVISNMDQPLGNYIGTLQEVNEAHNTLAFTRQEHDNWFAQSGIPEGHSVWHRHADLIELCEVLGASLLVISGRCPSLGEGKVLMREHLRSGAAFNKFEVWVQAQGGDLAKLQTRLNAAESWWSTVSTPLRGYVQHINSEGIGQIMVQMGAGRVKKGQRIRYDVNLALEAHVGDYLNSDAKEQLLMLLQYPLEYPQQIPPEIKQQLAATFIIGPEPVSPKPIILDVIL